MSASACKLGEQCPFIYESKNGTDKKKSKRNQRENFCVNKLCKYFEGGFCNKKKRNVNFYTYTENTN